MSKERMPEILPVDAAARLNVAILGEGDDRRFHAVVSEWWRRMPEEAKRVMVPFWSEGDCRRCRFSWGPLVGLLEDWPGRTDAACATFINDRDTNKFYVAVSSYYFDKMPDEEAIVLLAHEFGHLYQLATGTLYSHKPLSREEAIRFFEQEYGDTYEKAQALLKPDMLEGAIMDVAHKHDPVEVENDSIVRDWGFDLETLHRFDREVASKIPTPPRR